MKKQLSLAFIALGIYTPPTIRIKEHIIKSFAVFLITLFVMSSFVHDVSHLYAAHHGEHEHCDEHEHSESSVISEHCDEHGHSESSVISEHYDEHSHGHTTDSDCCVDDHLHQEQLVKLKLRNPFSKKLIDPPFLLAHMYCPPPVTPPLAMFQQSHDLSSRNALRTVVLRI